MTLRTYPDVEQRSAEWYNLRRGIVTASTVGQLVTPSTLKPARNDASRGLTALLVSERITGWTVDTYQSAEMLRGVLDEPVARSVYAEHYGAVTECGFMVNDDTGHAIGYSPDGLVGDDGLIEIKSRAPKAQVALVISGEIPHAHMAQCQAALLVSGRAWIDYVAFCGGMALWVKRIEPDSRWFEAIDDAVQAFEANAAQQIEAYRAAVVGLPMTERTFYEMDVVI